MDADLRRDSRQAIARKVAGVEEDMSAKMPPSPPHYIGGAIDSRRPFHQFTARVRSICRLFVEPSVSKRSR